MGSALYLSQEYRGVIGHFVQKHRELQGLSGAELAILLGYSRTSERVTGVVTEWETGRSEPHMTAIFKLAEILGPDFVDDLYTEMFKIAMNGLGQKRDRHLYAAAQIAEGIKERRLKYLDRQQRRANGELPPLKPTRDPDAPKRKPGPKKGTKRNLPEAPPEAKPEPPQPQLEPPPPPPVAEQPEFDPELQRHIGRLRDDANNGANP